MLRGFFRELDISLRTIAQSIHRLGLVFASMRSDQQSFATAAVVALILRTIDPDIYHRFARGEASDLDVVDAVFARAGITNLQQKHVGRLFEAVIILAAEEGELNYLRGTDPINSPLFRQYQDLVSPPVEADNASEREHADEVMTLVRELGGDLRHRGLGFQQAVQRLELLAPSLIDDRTEAVPSDS